MNHKYYTADEVMNLLEPRIREMFHKDRTTDNVEISEELYTIIGWDDVKLLRTYEDFYEHAVLVVDPILVDKYGHSAYYVEKNWINNKM